jgi:hypothetical protein
MGCEDFANRARLVRFLLSISPTQEIRRFRPPSLTGEYKLEPSRNMTKSRLEEGNSAMAALPALREQFCMQAHGLRKSRQIRKRRSLPE